MHRQQFSGLLRTSKSSARVSREQSDLVEEAQTSASASSRRYHALLSTPKVPTDKVVPLLNIDSDLVLMLSMVHTMFTFPGVLDVAKLKDSLHRLLKREGWNKLSARMRRNVSLSVYRALYVHAAHRYLLHSDCSIVHIPSITGLIDHTRVHLPAEQSTSVV